MTPRQLTTDEVRARFLAHVHALVEWWDKESRVTDTREKLDGLAFSILSALDGCNGALPRFVVAPNPHFENAVYLRSRGENWYPGSPNVACDIAGCLHELYYKHGDGAGADAEASDPLAELLDAKARLDGPWPTSDAEGTG